MAWKNVPDTRPRRLPVSATGRPCASVTSTNGPSLPFVDNRGVVEFVATHDVANGTDRIVGQQTRLPIAEVELSFGEACRVAEQARHGVASALGVLQAFAENHVAAALAMHCACLREFRQAAPKMARRRQLAGVQFRITAWQPADIAVVRWRLVTQRRERHDLRAGATPAIEHVGIDERKGCVRRQSQSVGRVASAERARLRR